MKNENIDVCEGDIFPINSKEQGKAFEQFNGLMSFMRYHQLIKKITYKIKIEYYPERLTKEGVQENE